MLRLLDSDLTLIRLAFRISPEQMDAFDSVYESLLIPVLDRCGFVPAQTPLRPMPEGVFARLFVVETPGALQQRRVNHNVDSHAALARFKSLRQRERKSPRSMAVTKHHSRQN